MRTALAGFLGFGVFKNVGEEPGMHLSHRELVDLLEVLDIPQLEIVEREAIETVPFRVDIHRAVVGTAEINVPDHPLLDTRNRLAAMIKKPLHQRVFFLLDIIQKTGWERAVEPETHLRELLQNIQHHSSHFWVIADSQRDVILFPHNRESRITSRWLRCLQKRG